MGRLFEEDGPTQVCRPLCAERDERRPQHGQVGVELPVLGAGAIFGPQGVAHPMIADFAPAPVAANGGRKVFRRSGQAAAQVVGSALNVGGCGDAGGFMHNDQTAHVGQVRFQRFQREDFDAPRVEATVVGV